MFCGVHFMAETAAILSPDKTVLIPDLDAGCSLSDSITADQLRAWKAQHPGAIVVMYVNTSAEVKAETDYCCTSSNAVKVVEHIFREHGDDTKVLFGPDMWLGAYVARETGRDIEVWDGECHVHAGIRPADINALRASEPQAEFLIHPECGCTTQVMEYVASGDVAAEGTHFLSTEGMMRHARDSEQRHDDRRDRDRHPAPHGAGEPGQDLHPGEPGGGLQVHEDDHAAQAARLAARHEARVSVPADVADRARVPIERMVSDRRRRASSSSSEDLRLERGRLVVDPAPAHAVEDLRAAVREVVLHALDAQLHRRVAGRGLHRLPDHRGACNGR